MSPDVFPRSIIFYTKCDITVRCRHKCSIFATFQTKRIKVIDHKRCDMATARTLFWDAFFKLFFQTIFWDKFFWNLPLKLLDEAHYHIRCDIAADGTLFGGTFFCILFLKTFFWTLQKKLYTFLFFLQTLFCILLDEAHPSQLFEDTICTSAYSKGFEECGKVLWEKNWKWASVAANNQMQQNMFESIWSSPFNKTCLGWVGLGWVGGRGREGERLKLIANGSIFGQLPECK